MLGQCMHYFHFFMIAFGNLEGFFLSSLVTTKHFGHQSACGLVSLGLLCIRSVSFI